MPVQHTMSWRGMCTSEGQRAAIAEARYRHQRGQAPALPLAVDQSRFKSVDIRDGTPAAPACSEDGVTATEARKPSILLIEDDLALASMLSDELSARSYVVWHAESAGDAEAAIDQVRPDLILLDLMLPDRNGLLMCASIKARAEAPVIICSATKRQDDAAIGLQLGADDFLRKPFSVDELQARIELTLRRRPPPAGKELRPADQVERLGALTIDTARCVVTVGGEVLPLTPTEYRLLNVLAGRAGEVISRRELAERIWGCIDGGVLRSLDVHMRRLRTKLAAAAHAGPYLVTRRGFGYQLVDDVDVPVSG